VQERFVVIGAGTMGVGIAYVAANGGYHVELVEVDHARGAQALREMDGHWQRAIERGKLTEAAVALARTMVNLVGEVTELTHAPHVVVEAVPERLELKRSVLHAAEALDPRLLASNTSSISIATLSERLARPERLVGLHFFNPVWAMPLLEIVVGPATGAPSVADAVEIARRLGKDAIQVRDAPGFATSRLGVALGLEAIRMLEDGVASAADIDKAMVLGYRHPVGPLELTDLVGLDVRLDIARTLQRAYGDRYAPPPLLTRLVAEGRLGRKSGEGFYRWVDGVIELRPSGT
jgi:3-hydroxybutyryl-CoA dehydrogenase